MKFQRLSPRAALAVLSLFSGLLGFGLVVWGLWLVHQPTAMVVAGVALLAYAKLVDRAASRLVVSSGRKVGG